MCMWAWGEHVHAWGEHVHAWGEHVGHLRTARVCASPVASVTHKARHSQARLVGKWRQGVSCKEGRGIATEEAGGCQALGAQSTPNSNRRFTLIVTITLTNPAVAEP